MTKVTNGLHLPNSMPNTVCRQHCIMWYFNYFFFWLFHILSIIQTNYCKLNRPVFGYWITFWLNSKNCYSAETMSNFKKQKMSKFSFSKIKMIGDSDRIVSLVNKWMNAERTFIWRYNILSWDHVIRIKYHGFATITQILFPDAFTIKCWVLI